MSPNDDGTSQDNSDSNENSNQILLVPPPPISVQFVHHGSDV